MQRRWLIIVVVCAGLTGLWCDLAWPQFGPPEAEPAAGETKDDRAAKEANEAHERNAAQYKADADMLVLPGLLANRKEKWVRIWGKATGLSANDPLEFFLIPPDSGKDYEALAVGFVKPSDVHKALEFIGMKAGKGVDFGANRFWAKGERVIVYLEWDQAVAGGAAERKKVRAEELALDVRTGRPLPRGGFVFAGSFQIDLETGTKVYAADAVDPKSIISDFNCRPTVMDVPRQAIQGEVYGMQKANPAHKFSPGQPVQIVLEPEHKDGTKRVVELVLGISMPPGQKGAQGAKFELMDAAGKQVGTGQTLVHVMAAFNQLVESGKDPFVGVWPDDGLTVQQVREIYKLLMSMDNERGIRIEPPPAGHLFYRAFFPDEQWRDRKKRLGRPWELHLRKEGGKTLGLLILPADDIDNNNGLGDLKFNVNDPEEAAKVLLEKSDRWSQIVYVFAPKDLNYGQLMTFIRPGMKTHPTMYVFEQK